VSTSIKKLEHFPISYSLQGPSLMMQTHYVCIEGVKIGALHTYRCVEVWYPFEWCSPPVKILFAMVPTPEIILVI